MAEFKAYEGQTWSLNDVQKKFFEQMEKELNTPITVVHGRGQRNERREDAEGIVIFDYSTNSENPTPRRIDYISRKNGTTVKLNNHFLLKPDDSREHIFDFNGFPLCEMRMGTLWVLLPLQNFDTEELIKEFWADALRMCMNKKFFEEKENEKKRKIKEAFLSAMRASNEGEINQQDEEIRKQSAKLAELNAQLVSTQTGLIRAEQRKTIAEKLAAGDEETYDRELTSLLNHTQIKRIDFNKGQGVLEIYTHLIYLYSPNRSERAQLGEFLIKVNTKQNNTITIHNLTNQRSHKMHPHVEGNGSACWGAIGTQVARLAAACRIEGLADMVIRYLETYNVQDGNAQYAKYWFTPKDTEKQRKDFDGQWMTEAAYATALKQKKEEVKEEKNKAVVKAPEKVEQLTDKQLKELA